MPHPPAGSRFPARRRYEEAMAATVKIDSPEFQLQVVKLQAAIKYATCPPAYPGSWPELASRPAGRLAGLPTGWPIACDF